MQNASAASYLAIWYMDFFLLQAGKSKNQRHTKVLIPTSSLSTFSDTGTVGKLLIDPRPHRGHGEDK
jgi:hypothetical protein